MVVIRPKSCEKMEEENGDWDGGRAPVKCFVRRENGEAEGPAGQ